MTGFEHYYGSIYQQAIQNINDALNSRTDLPIPERLSVKLNFVHERGVCPLPTGIEGKFIRNTIAKLSQEMFAFIWCLRGGSLYGAYQRGHYRAVSGGSHHCSARKRFPYCDRRWFRAYPLVGPHPVHTAGGRQAIPRPTIRVMTVP